MKDNNNLAKNGEYFPSKISGNFQDSFIKKDVKWHDKNKGYKKIMINKSDNLNVDVGDEVYLITYNQMQQLNKTINENEIKISELESDIKRSHETINKKVDNAVHETTIKYQSDIDKLNKEINQLKEDMVETIADINLQHNKEIKEYQELYQKSLDKIKSLNDEIKQLKGNEFNYAIQYNNLRQEIINIGWIGAIRNKHKAVAREYPPLKIGADNTAIEINTDTTKD